MRHRVPSKRLGDSIKYNSNSNELENLSKGFANGYYKDVRLADKVKDKIRSFKEDLSSAEASDIISTAEKSKGAEILEKMENERIIEEKEAQEVVSIYSSIAESINSSLINYRERSWRSTESERNIGEVFLEEVRGLENRGTREKIEDFLTNAKRGYYVTELSQVLLARWGEGFSKSNVQRIIDRLDGQTIETEGGWGATRKKRLCYPKITGEEMREIRKGKEHRFVGEITENITNYFELKSGIPSMQVHRFQRENSGDLYLLAKKRLPLEREMTSIGLYKEGNLQQVMQNKGYKLRENFDNSDVIDKDSQIAYVVSSGDELLYRDRYNERARELYPQGDQQPRS